MNGYKLSYTAGLLYAWPSCVQCMRRMGLDSFALGCSGSLNTVYCYEGGGFFLKN